MNIYLISHVLTILSVINTLQATSPISNTTENNTIANTTINLTKLTLKSVTTTEERKHLSLFPKKKLKFVIKEQNKKYKPESNAINNKKLSIMRKLEIKAVNNKHGTNSLNNARVRPSLMKHKIFTTTLPSIQPITTVKTPRKQLISPKKLFSHRKGQEIHENIIIVSNKTEKLNEKESNIGKEDNYTTTTDHNSVLSEQIDIKQNSTKGDEVIVRKKRFSVKNAVLVPGLFKNYWLVPMPVTKSYEEMDAEEFIFIGAPKRTQVVKNKPKKSKPIKSPKKEVKTEPTASEPDFESVTDLVPGSYE